MAQEGNAMPVLGIILCVTLIGVFIARRGKARNSAVAWWHTPQAHTAFVKELDTPLLRLSPHDTWTARDACGGLHFWGGIGGGKTSAAHWIAGAYLRAGMGGCVTATKPEEVELWQRYARKHGRGGSLILFDENEGFNFLAYEMALHGVQGIGTVVECLMRVMDAARKASGTASHRGGDVFWDDTCREVLRYALPLLYAANGTLRISDIIRFISSAPSSVKEATDDQWRARSFLFQTLKAAVRKPRVRIEENVLSDAVDYWGLRFPSIPDKTRGNIVISVTTTLDRFMHGRLQRTFCGRTSIVPELSFHGSILLLAMPTTVWGEDAIIAQQLFKFLWQKTVLARNSLAPKHRERFVFLWSDEAQDLVNSYDYEFLSLCRSSKCCVTYLTQSLPTYFAKIAADNPQHAALALAGKFMGHVFCSNSCPETNEFAARMIGKAATYRRNYSRGTSENINRGMSTGSTENWGSSSGSGFSFAKGGGGTSYNSGSSSGGGSNWGDNRGRGTGQSETSGCTETIEYVIEPGEFARSLKTGGPQNGNEVTGVWFMGGRVFKATGTNFLLGRFRQ